MAEKNMPEKKFKSGAVCATIWPNKMTKNNKEIEFKTVALDRNYKDREGNWKSTSTLRTNDIADAELVLRKAYEYIKLREPDVQNGNHGGDEIDEEVIM